LCPEQHFPQYCGIGLRAIIKGRERDPTLLELLMKESEKYN
jgi:hypothetical protein